MLVGLQGISEAIKRVGILRGLSPQEVGLDEPPLYAPDPMEAEPSGAEH